LSWEGEGGTGFGEGPPPRRRCRAWALSLPALTPAVAARSKRDGKGFDERGRGGGGPPMAPIAGAKPTPVPARVPPSPGEGFLVTATKNPTGLDTGEVTGTSLRSPQPGHTSASLRRGRSMSPRPPGMQTAGSHGAQPASPSRPRHRHPRPWCPRCPPSPAAERWPQDGGDGGRAGSGACGSIPPARRPGTAERSPRPLPISGK